MTALLAIGWSPEIRGIVTVLIGFVVLCGSVYLLLATNVGIRLGFLIAFAALFGWMASMGAIWWTYGIGLKGREPTWEPAEPYSIVRDANELAGAGVLDAPIVLPEGIDYPTIAGKAADAIQASGWELLAEDDPGRGQAIASADEIIQVEAELFEAGEYQAVDVFERGGERFPKINDTLDFLAFFHEPHYALVEVASLVPQREEPGRAPARPVIDETQPHQYVLMLRDLGTKRQPAMVITLTSSLMFALSCYLLHRRDRIVTQHRSAVAAKG